MRCSEFRAQHCAFVDDTLAGVELIRMKRHILECRECATHDARIRRALLLARNLPNIDPSPDFFRRLEARLLLCQEHPDNLARINFKTVATIGVVASLFMLGYVASALNRTGIPPQDLVLPPVVAMATPPQPEIVLPIPSISLPYSAAIGGSFPGRVPIWPTVPFMEQAPIHVVSYQQVH
jgi:hypothetical protein